MKVLHVYPKSDSLIERHVTLLAEGMRQSAEVKVADNAVAFRKLFRDVVATLHGQLEPWVVKRQSVQENVSKTFLWQRSAIERAYAIIVHGKLELSNFKQLGWNKRMEEIHNAVITNAIAPSEMCAQTFAVYQKVMDSNTLEQMDDDSLHALAQIIKVGIMGDRRWVKDLNINESQIDWRRLLLYAEHENISNYVDYDIRRQPHRLLFPRQL